VPFHKLYTRPLDRVNLVNFAQVGDLDEAANRHGSDAKSGPTIQATAALCLSIRIQMKAGHVREV
jgi:hypothetical protein